MHRALESARLKKIIYLCFSIRKKWLGKMKKVIIVISLSFNVRAESRCTGWTESKRYTLEGRFDLLQAREMVLVFDMTRLSK